MAKRAIPRGERDGIEGSPDRFEEVLLHPPEQCMTTGDTIEAERSHLLLCLVWFVNISPEEVLWIAAEDFVLATRELRLPRLKRVDGYPRVERAEVSSDDLRVILPSEVAERLQRYLQDKSQGRIFSAHLRRAAVRRAITQHANRLTRGGGTLLLAKRRAKGVVKG